MSLKGMTIKTGATLVHPTVGTDAILKEAGVDIKNGVYVAETAHADFITRINATFQNRPPSLQSDGSYSKAKRSCKIVTPIVLADGTTSFCLGRYELEIHPQMTAAEVSNLRGLLAQCITDAEVDDFITSGSTE